MIANLTLNNGFIITSPKRPSIGLLFLTVLVMVTCGSFTYKIYPVWMNMAALGVIVTTFFLCLVKRDFFSFMILLLFANHFPLALPIGGVFNLAAFLSLVFCGFINPQAFDLTCLGRGKYLKLLVVFFIIQVLSVISGNEFAMSARAIAIYVFLEILVLFYFTTKVVFHEKDFIYLLKFIGLFIFYMFLVSVNQKYEFFQSQWAAFPSLDKTVEYEMNITRSSGTLINFEAYSEYCLSVIAIFLPGVLTRTAGQNGKWFYAFSIAVIVVAVLSIVLSGTRSSVFLLPLLVVMTIVLTAKRLSIKTMVLICLAGSAIWFINLKTQVIDFDVFAKRSESLTSGNVSLKGLVSGEEMNRGGIFKYAAQKIGKSAVILGGGYFTSPEEYKFVHFDTHSKTIGDIPDYHNLYLGSLVIWGIIGLVILLYLFISNIISGARLYLAIRNTHTFCADLLLGFSLMFFFLLVNQLKIQFIREPSYFVLILILLAVYRALTDHLRFKYNK